MSPDGAPGRRSIVPLDFGSRTRPPNAPSVVERRTRSGPWLVVEIVGEMDLLVGAMLSDVGTDPCLVVFDLQGVTFMDCASLGALVAAQRRAVAAGGAVRLAAVSDQVRRVLTLTGLDRGFPQFDTVRAATSLPGAPAETPGDDRVGRSSRGRGASRVQASSSSSRDRSRRRVSGGCRDDRDGNLDRWASRAPMSRPSDRTAEVRALIERQGSEEGDRPGPVGGIQRLCRAAAIALPATGVAVSLVAASGPQVTVAASAQEIEQIEELQFSLGEGPCLAAYETRRPVLIPDLRTGDSMPWPGYAAAASDHGVRAVFAFPLQVGGARLGAMDVYRDAPGPLSLEALGVALTFAEIATMRILDAQSRDESRDHVVHDAVANNYAVYQAQGMVMIQLGVNLTEAMARLRAHAYAHDRPLGDVANDIIAGKLALESDAP